MKKLMLTVFLGLILNSVVFAQTIKDFELRWMNHPSGDSSVLYKSADYEDAIFVVEAYFRSCPYCNDNAPLVNQLAEYYADEPRVHVLDVGRDCKESDYQKWISTHNPNHPVLNDCNMQLLKQLGVSAYPTTIIIDSSRKIRYKHVGAWSSSAMNTIKNKIDNILAE